MQPHWPPLRHCWSHWSSRQVNWSRSKCQQAVEHTHSPVLTSHSPAPLHASPLPLASTPGHWFSQVGPQNPSRHMQVESVAWRPALDAVSGEPLQWLSSILTPHTCAHESPVVHTSPTLAPQLQSCWPQSAPVKRLPSESHWQKHRPSWLHTPWPEHGLVAPPGHSLEQPSPYQPRSQSHVLSTKFGTPLPLHQSSTGLSYSSVTKSPGSITAPGGAWHSPVLLGGGGGGGGGRK